MVCFNIPYFFNFLKAAFHKLYLVHYWILRFLCDLGGAGYNSKLWNQTKVKHFPAFFLIYSKATVTSKEYVNLEPSFS